MKRLLLTVCMAALLASCDAKAPAPKASGSSTPSTRSGTLALISSELVNGQTVFDTVRFVLLDGTQISTFKLPANATPPTVGGDRVFYVADGEVRSVDASGTSVNHGKFMDKEPVLSKLVVSPDGKRWAWSIAEIHGTSVTSKVFVAGEGSDNRRILLQKTSTEETELTPVLWSPSGLVVVEMPIGIGGLIFFDDLYWGRSSLVDPDTGMSSILTRDADECPLNDVASDGSWTCIAGLGHGGGSVGTPAKGTVVLHRAGSTRVELALEAKAKQVGNAVIGPQGARVAVGIFTGTRPDDSQALSTVVFDVATGEQSLVGSNDSVPVAWLSDGSLVLEGADFGHPSGCSLFRSDRSIVKLGAGRFIGFLDIAGSIVTRG
jgi:hypothetical protein